MKITSLQNSIVKRTVKLRSRKWREREKVMLIEGIRAVRRALDAEWELEQMLFCPDLFRDQAGPELLRRARRIGLETIDFARAPFEKMSYRERPEGVIAVGAPAGRRLDQLELGDRPLILLAEGIEKPGNLGSMLRVADGAGADALLLADGTTDINNPNVVRSSVGALFGVPIVEDSSANIRCWLSEKGIASVAASPAAAELYCNVDLSGPLAILVGAEQPGLSDFWLESAELKVRIPMRGSVDSLNVSTSAAVLLYEALRQRRPTVSRSF